MVENSSSSPVFAGRYRFQTVGNDWVRGRSRSTYLVFDMKNGRLGVIKQEEIKSEQVSEELTRPLDIKDLGISINCKYSNSERIIYNV